MYEKNYVKAIRNRGNYDFESSYVNTVSAWTLFLNKQVAAFIF